jgi:NAD(P)-dependent dehydrogenase (short-subunit alcohol dehydrogenase family)
MLSFKGKVAVVTGGGGDIGRAASILLAKQGAKVLVVDMDQDGIQKTLSEIWEAGGQAEGFKADVTKSADCKAYAKKAADLWGGIDAFFNNAGIEGKGAPLAEYPEDEFDKVMAVNVKGVFLGIKAVVPHMKEGAAIVNTSSLAGLQGFPMLGAYVASKHAIIGMTRTAAAELAASNIRVNAICPSPITGRMMSSVEQETESSEEAFRQIIPLGRYGTPQEVANLAIMLLSDEAGYITGGYYTIDGGASAA